MSDYSLPSATGGVLPLHAYTSHADAVTALRCDRHCHRPRLRDLDPGCHPLVGSVLAEVAPAIFVLQHKSSAVGSRLDEPVVACRE